MLLSSSQRLQLDVHCIFGQVLSSVWQTLATRVGRWKLRLFFGPWENNENTCPRIHGAPQGHAWLLCLGSPVLSSERGAWLTILFAQMAVPLQWFAVMRLCSSPRSNNTAGHFFSWKAYITFYFLSVSFRLGLNVNPAKIAYYSWLPRNCPYQLTRLPKARNATMSLWFFGGLLHCFCCSDLADTVPKAAAGQSQGLSGSKEKECSPQRERESLS